MRGFASDNYAGVHPEVLEAIASANVDHAKAYGDDDWTARADVAFREHFGADARAFPVFNGTGANVVGLQVMLRPWEAVICASSAHINVDEGGAPEHQLGTKLIDVATPDGKLTPDLVRSVHFGVGVVHHAQPRVISITQTTEMGTAYSPDEIGALAEFAHSLDMYLHLDGARISNAAATLGVPLRAFTTDAGVDMVSYGGTKNGALAAEAVVCLRPELAEVLGFARKQSMQLASKMRFFSAQFVALLEGDLWLRNASHANAMAHRLVDGVSDVAGVEIGLPVQANGLFPVIPRAAIEPLQEVTPFYVWDEARNQVRWMCSWDTTENDIDTFVAAVRTQLA